MKKLTSLALIAMAMLIAFPIAGVAKDNKKEKKAYEWKWDGTKSGNETVDAYLMSVDSIWNNMSEFHKMVDTYQYKEDTLYVNGKYYVQAYMMDNQGNLLTRGAVNWQFVNCGMLSANSPINATLRPCREDSVDFDNTQNLYIEGDNLDVLKCLKETYLHKVKMIYIDPPYNTGNDFVYEDDFAQSSEEYLANSGQFDGIDL